MMEVRYLVGCVIGLVLIAGSTVSVEAKSKDELSKESTDYCVETGKDAAKLTPQMIIEKVNAAAKLIEKEGEAAFPKFKGKGSEFIFCGTYIWIHDMNGVMLMHPIKHKMEGRPLLNLKDRKGKMFFVEMNKVAKENGSGWVEYVWPKPGERKVSPKISYVKLAKHGDKEYVIGCGVYDMSKADVEKATK